MRFASFVALVGFIAVTAAHPGHDHDAEAAVRREFMKNSKRDLSHCTEHLQARGHVDRQIARRQELLRSLRLAQGLDKRDLSDLNKSHESEEDYSLLTPPEILFGQNNSCILNPEVMEGPYYVAGEFVRSDVSEAQSGVPLYIDTQAIDVNTCEPIPDIFVEIWSCNATGVYSGVSGFGNGNIADTDNLDRTFLRGIQHTDSDGISLFKTIFPGHYIGRTTHVHVMTHLNGTILPNGTMMNTVASHVGQMYFDQDLIDEIEALEPYTENTQPDTLNVDDWVLSQEALTVDPLMNWVYLGGDVKDGILAWLSFGIDTNFARNVTPGSFLYKEGGVANPIFIPPRPTP